MRLDGLNLWSELSDKEFAFVRHVGLYHVLHFPEVTTNKAMITTLVECWNSETCFFHLPIGEASITLEDVWHILHIPIHGMRVIYDHQVGIYGVCELRECIEEELQIRGRYEIPWEVMDYDELTIVLWSVVVGLLILDRRTHGFPVGWGRVIHDMIVHRWVFEWGPCLLATLYHQMHDTVYLR